MLRVPTRPGLLSRIGSRGFWFLVYQVFLKYNFFSSASLSTLAKILYSSASLPQFEVFLTNNLFFTYTQTRCLLGLQKTLFTALLLRIRIGVYWVYKNLRHPTPCVVAHPVV